MEAGILAATARRIQVLRVRGMDSRPVGRRFHEQFQQLKRTRQDIALCVCTTFPCRGTDSRARQCARGGVCSHASKLTRNGKRFFLFLRSRIHGGKGLGVLRVDAGITNALSFARAERETPSGLAG